MLTDNFESRVTRGLVQWITLIETNDTLATLRIGLTNDPETGATDRHIDFTAVTKVVSDWFEQEDDFLESIIGAHQDHDGKQFRYMFHTEKRELWVWAYDPATIFDNELN